jgi:uncharacterized damage-inducible protein DinB
MSDTDQYLKDIRALHRAVHKQMLAEIADLESEVLNWTPALETSSIGTIITHALGAEAEMLRNLLGIPTERNRDDEFSAQDYGRDELEERISRAEADWDTLGSRLSESELRTLIPRPNKPTPESGLFWLMRNYGHLREHLAQIQLTRQLYLASHL